MAKVRRLEAPRFGQCRRRGCDQDERLLADAARPQLAEDGPAADYRHVEIVGGHPLEELELRGDRELQREWRVAAAIRGKNAGQPVESGGLGCSQTDAPDRAARHPLDAFARAVNGGQNTASVFEQELARHRERHPAAVAIQETRAEALLQLADLVRHRRLREIAAVGGTREVAQLGDGAERLQHTHVHDSPVLSQQSKRFIGRIARDAARVADMAIGCPLDLDAIQLRAEVRSMYSRVAAAPGDTYHFHRGPAYASAWLGYDAAALSELPADVTACLAGVGNPLAIGRVPAGARVLDVGSGGGTDLLLAAHQAGPDGRAVGIDITAAMRARALNGARACGLAHVELVAADATALPIDSGSIDVVISNGVLDLVPEKEQAFAESARVLRPGGRI